jgi:hypothetical protein
MSVDLQPEPVRTGPEFVQYEVTDRVATILWGSRTRPPALTLASM